MFLDDDLDYFGRLGLGERPFLDYFLLILLDGYDWDDLPPDLSINSG